MIILFSFSASYNALVVKASGLAAGKGVIVAASKEDAVKAVHSLKEVSIFNLMFYLF